MADVRLTATNPEDSSVVPVACNDKGELKLEEIPSFDGNVDGDLTVSGSATFAGKILSGESPTGGDNVGVYLDGPEGGVVATTYSSGNSIFKGFTKDNFTSTVNIKAGGSALFAGQVTSSSTGDWNLTTDTLQSYMNEGGFVVKRQSTEGSSSKAIVVKRSTGSGGVDDVATIAADGSSKFAGGKCGFTSDGRLWVTDNKNETWATLRCTNGIMNWEQYTPPTKMEQIKESIQETVQIDPTFGVSPETDTGTP